MPFKIIRNDITKVKADIIVNTANPKPIYASGTDLAIYQAAGVDVLTKAAGVTLREIVNIDYSWTELEFVSRPMNSMMLEECCMKRCEDSDDIDINPDDINVTDSVTVAWALG